ncbi:MAG TPA: hypothetical protein VHA09_06755, partial [Nitrososphaera sp.]|nr:hypothetical protein [Nitrososphaera sp.]
MDRTINSSEKEPADIKYLMRKYSFSPLPERNNSRKFVLMMSRNHDPEADYLAGILLSKGINYVRINLDSISENLRLACSINGETETKNSLMAYSEELDVTRIGAVWLHHYNLSEINFNSSNMLAHKFAYEQWSDALYSFGRCLHCAWINEPFATMHGSNHVEQLSVAKSLGFDIPATLITNDPKSAREFYHLY